MNSLNECSSSTILSVVRTIEFMDAARHHIMYSNLVGIYRNNLLTYVILAIADIRLRNRIQLPWVEMCVVFASKLPPTFENTPWPLLVVVSDKLYVVHKGSVLQRTNCIQAFMTWHNMCLEKCDGVIDGRWNVVDYTI